MNTKKDKKGIDYISLLIGLLFVFAMMGLPIIASLIINFWYVMIIIVAFIVVILILVDFRIEEKKHTIKEKEKEKSRN
jgi:uncharacterized membrane protein